MCVSICLDLTMDVSIKAVRDFFTCEFKDAGYLCVNLAEISRQLSYGELVFVCFVS